MAVNNSLTNNKNKQPAFSTIISSEGYRKMINNTLRDPKKANRFIASITSAVVTNKELQACEPDSIVSAALLGEALELSPSPQLAQYYLIPYKDKKRENAQGEPIKVAQFQLGVNGYKQLAIRSGQYLDIDAIEIRQGEYLGRDTETGKPLFEFIEDDEVRENAPVIGYLGYFELLNGFKKRVYFSYEKMLNHADKYSQAFKKEVYKQLQEGKIPEKDLWKYSSPWYSGFDGMALKTVIRQLISKWGIMSIEMQDAYVKDMGVINQDGTVDYIDNDYTTVNVPEDAQIEPQATEIPEVIEDVGVKATEGDFKPPTDDEIDAVFGD